MWIYNFWLINSIKRKISKHGQFSACKNLFIKTDNNEKIFGKFHATKSYLKILQKNLKTIYIF
jgi:hypothetical protein